MIYVRPFKKEDLATFVPIEALRPVEIEDPALAKAIEDSCLSVTGIRNGEVAGCAGVHPVDELSGELWLRLSKNCLKHKIETIRLLRDGLKIIEDTYPFKQLNATIKCCFAQSVKMVEYLGFKRIKEVEQDGIKWYLYSKRLA